MALSMNLGAEDKKKLYLLGGLLGVLGILGTFFVLLPAFRGDSSNENTETSISTNNAVASASPATTPPSNGAGFGTATTVGASSSTNASGAGGVTSAPVLSPQLIGVRSERRDPFSPEEVVPIFVAPPEPPPRFVPKVTYETLPPQSIPPYSPTFESTTIPLLSDVGATAPTSANGIGGADSRILLHLPPASIFGTTARVSPRSIPVVGGLEVAAPGAQANIVSDDDKRVAGVIIGDSIRALIEYRENGQTVSRVVQPGDMVGGMEILSIGRVSEGGEQLVRVTVRENGQEKYFDLKSR